MILFCKSHGVRAEIVGRHRKFALPAIGPSGGAQFSCALLLNPDPKPGNLTVPDVDGRDTQLVCNVVEETS